MVGQGLIRALVSGGFRNIVSNLHKREADAAGTPSIRFVALDLTRQSDTEIFFSEERPVYVFGAAARVGGILANDTYKAQFIYDNLMIAANLVHAAYRFGARKLLNLGSSCIYPKLAPQPLTEDHLLTGSLEPTNEPYAVAKISAIKLCRYFNEQYGTDFISVMPSNLYGSFDNFDLETAHVLPAMIRKFHLAKLLRAGDMAGVRDDCAARAVGFGIDERAAGADDKELTAILHRLGITAEAVTLWGTGEPYREFLHVDDLAAACMLLMERYSFSDMGEFVNVGAGADLRIRDLAALVRRIVGFEGQIRFDPSKQEGTPRKLLDVSRIRALGWNAETPLEEGIRATYNWYAGRTA